MLRAQQSHGHVKACSARLGEGGTYTVSPPVIVLLSRSDVCHTVAFGHEEHLAFVVQLSR